VCERKHIQSHADEADRDFPQLAIILAVIGGDKRRIPVEGLGSGEIDPMRLDILATLGLIPGVLALFRYGSNCSYNQMSRQAGSGAEYGA
jgi:hypothetical protein